jgi:hypothetical protein
MNAIHATENGFAVTVQKVECDEMTGMHCSRAISFFYYQNINVVPNPIPR